jgi:ATP-dependent DNA helicase RecG
MNEQCADAGLPHPLYYYESSGFWVEFRKNIYFPEYLKDLGLNERQIDVVLYVKEKGEITTSAYTKRYNIADRTARQDLSELINKQILKRIGETNLAKYILV